MNEISEYELYKILDNFGKDDCVSYLFKLINYEYTIEEIRHHILSVRRFENAVINGRV